MTAAHSGSSPPKSLLVQGALRLFRLTSCPLDPSLAPFARELGGRRLTPETGLESDFGRGGPASPRPQRAAAAEAQSLPSPFFLWHRPKARDWVGWTGRESTGPREARTPEANSDWRPEPPPRKFLEAAEASSLLRRKFPRKRKLRSFAASNPEEGGGDRPALLSSFRDCSSSGSFSPLPRFPPALPSLAVGKAKTPLKYKHSLGEPPELHEIFLTLPLHPCLYTRVKRGKNTTSVPRAQAVLQPTPRPVPARGISRLLQALAPPARESRAVSDSLIGVPGVFLQEKAKPLVVLAFLISRVCQFLHFSTFVVSSPAKLP
ncbi:uncharacterized protein LOC116421027 [Sarcophilus harrisii]|uniref:uncharacterized protein LOC116421027 n=1 Tax=Sarcophilus harrisii TaxID=9305 RepID=UPI001301A520|nr:uncharacterized protein LOC116421027 [Sarcophilus harrisii]